MDRCQIGTYLSNLILKTTFSIRPAYNILHTERRGNNIYFTQNLLLKISTLVKIKCVLGAIGGSMEGNTYI